MVDFFSLGLKEEGSESRGEQRVCVEGAIKGNFFANKAICNLERATARGEDQGLLTQFGYLQSS